VVSVPYSLVAHDNILGQLKQRRWGVAIFDEVHYCKNVSAGRTHACIGPAGLIKNAMYAWGLSGTPMTNNPDDLYALLKAFAPKLIAKTPTKQKFVSRYCIQFGKWPRLKTVGAKNLPELKSKLFDTGLAIMRNKADVLADLPPKQYRMLPVEGDKKLSISIDSIDPELIADSATSITGELAEVRKEAGLAKLGAVARYIDDVLSVTRKLVVFAWHQDVVRAIRDQLEMDGIESVIYYGATSTRDKEEAKRRFINNNECRVFIGNIASAGVGLDGLQRVCSHALFAESPWTYAEIAQASDRLHRFGQVNPVIVDISVLTNSIEEYIVRAVLKKEDYFKKALITRFTITQ
jgi:SNF2 family DNA or RNA helicase